MEISGCNTPENNAWIHIRIDFLATGQYLELNPHQFRIIVDGTISQKYSYSSGISSVNRIEFGAYCSSTEKAYIDSIGFSWDE